MCKVCSVGYAVAGSAVATTSGGSVATESSVNPADYSSMRDTVKAITIPTIEQPKWLKQLEAAAEPLNNFRSYLDTGEQLQTTLRNNLISSKIIPEKQWQTEGLDTAVSLQTGIESIPAESKSAKALKKEALEYSDDLVASWRSLLKAHAAKDKASYLVATNGLAESYAAFSGLADTTDEKIAEQVELLGRLAVE